MPSARRAPDSILVKAIFLKSKNRCDTVAPVVVARLSPCAIAHVGDDDTSNPTKLDTRAKRTTPRKTSIRQRRAERVCSIILGSVSARPGAVPFLDVGIEGRLTITNEPRDAAT